MRDELKKKSIFPAKQPATSASDIRHVMDNKHNDQKKGPSATRGNRNSQPAEKRNRIIAGAAEQLSYTLITAQKNECYG